MLHILRLSVHAVIDKGTWSPGANHAQALSRRLLSAAHARIRLPIILQPAGRGHPSLPGAPVAYTAHVHTVGMV
jgi:hypothetical protein